MYSSGPVFVNTPPPLVIATTTWNPSDKDAAISLSNGNLTITGDSNTWAGIRSIASAASGKKFWQIRIDTLNATQNYQGFGDAITSLTSPPGFDSHGVGWQQDGHIWVNGGTLAAIDGWTQGDTLNFAVDITNNLAWFKVNSGDWNSSSAFDPAAGSGGIDISARAAGAIFAIGMVGRIGTGNDVSTANFGAVGPSGFGNL